MYGGNLSLQNILNQNIKESTPVLVIPHPIIGTYTQLQLMHLEAM